jgi:hypothetical protein
MKRAIVFRVVPRQIHLTRFPQSSLCVNAEIWVHGDGAILAPPVVLPFIDIPVEQDSAHACSLSTGLSSPPERPPERKWGEFPLDLQLRIADLPPDSKLVISLSAMTGAFSTKMIACTVMPLFRQSKKHSDGQLYMRTGRTHAFLWAGAEPDLSGKTPSHVAGRKAASLSESIDEKVSSSVRLLTVGFSSLMVSTAKLACRATVAVTRCTLPHPCRRLKKVSEEHPIEKLLILTPRIAD